MQPGAAVLVKARDASGLRSCSGGGQGSPGCLAQHLYPVLHPEQPAGDSGGWPGPGRRGGSSWGACITASISQATSFSRWADASGLSQGGHTCPGKHVGSLLYYPRRQGQLGAGGGAGGLQPFQAPMGWHQHVTRVCLDPSSRAPICSLWCDFSRDRKFKGH